MVNSGVGGNIGGSTVGVSLTIGCSNVATGWEGTPGADGEGVGWQQWGGGNSAVGVDNCRVGGGQQWGCLQPLRTTLHTISISLPNNLS